MAQVLCQCDMCQKARYVYRWDEPRRKEFISTFCKYGGWVEQKEKKLPKFRVKQPDRSPEMVWDSEDGKLIPLAVYKSRQKRREVRIGDVTRASAAPELNEDLMALYSMIDEVLGPGSADAMGVIAAVQRRDDVTFDDDNPFLTDEEDGLARKKKKKPEKSERDLDLHEAPPRKIRFEED